MKPEKLRQLASSLKRRYPELRDRPDEMVVQGAVNLGLIKLPVEIDVLDFDSLADIPPPPSGTSRSVSVNTSMPIFPGIAADRQEKLARYVRTQFDVAFTERRGQFESQHLDEHLNREEYLNWLMHISTMVEVKSSAVRTQADTRLMVTLTKAAIESGTDVPTMMSFVVQREQLRIKKEEKEHDVDQELRKAEGLKKIDREHEYKDGQNRIAIDSTAALADRQLEKSLEADLREAREDRYVIEVGDKPLILKQQLLSDSDAKIARIQRRIDGLQRDRQADSQEKAG